MDVSKNNGTPKSSIFNWVFHYKPSILGYPYFWKHPNTLRFGGDCTPQSSSDKGEPGSLGNGDQEIPIIIFLAYQAPLRQLQGLHPNFPRQVLT